ncbi:MAG TPA: hypothetical protein VLZ84_08470, partial [Asticcacaulis sp.]|nr:hypothetical protein [Asticcacaulis sp.]
MTHLRTAGLLAMAFLLPPPALAQNASPKQADIHIVECRPHNAAQDKADQALAMATLDVMQTHDLVKL